MLHVRDPLDDLKLLVHREPAENLRRLVVREMTKNQSDRLGVLFLNECEQVVTLCTLKKTEWSLLHLGLDLRKHALGNCRIERVLQDHPRVREGPLVGVLRCDRNVIELLDHLVLHLIGH